MAWAYDLDWSPVPVFQSYSAYTPALDEMNAKALADAPADQIVIRERNVANDNRNPQWDTPRYLLALACDYQVVAGDDHWTALRHTSDRCGPARRLSTRAVTLGQSVDVPTVGSDQVLLVRFAVRPSSLPVRAAQALYKDWTPVYITADGAVYRVPQALADGPLLARAPHGPGWAPAVDYHRLTFNAAGQVSFEVVDIR